MPEQTNYEQALATCSGRDEPLIRAMLAIVDEMRVSRKVPLVFNLGSSATQEDVHRVREMLREAMNG